MKSKELLKKAKADFEEEFGKSPKESGYSLIFPWKKAVLFSHNKKEVSAYIKSQHVAKAMIALAIIICLTLISYFILDISTQTAFIIGMVGILLMVILLGIRLNCVNVCKNKILIYEQD